MILCEFSLCSMRTMHCRIFYIEALHNPLNKERAIQKMVVLDKTTYRRAVRRKANLEVTGEEKPKTRLRRRKANKRLCREKSQFAPSQTKKSQFHLSQTKKSQFAPSSGEKLQQSTFRERKKSKSLS